MGSCIMLLSTYFLSNSVKFALIFLSLALVHTPPTVRLAAVFTNSTILAAPVFFPKPHLVIAALPNTTLLLCVLVALCPMVIVLPKVPVPIFAKLPITIFCVPVVIACPALTPTHTLSPPVCTVATEASVPAPQPM